MPRAGVPKYARSTPRPMPWPHSMRSGAVEYESWFEVMPGVRARYWNAGHLLGSASIEIQFDGAGRCRDAACAFCFPATSALTRSCCSRIRKLQPDLTMSFQNRPMATAIAHRPRPPSSARAPCHRGARGRCSERRHAYSGLCRRTHPRTDCRSHRPDGARRRSRPRRSFSIRPWRSAPPRCFADTPQVSIQSIDLDRLLSSPHLRFTETVDESKSIAQLSGFHIIIAASGMCDAGRIRHHLKRWLWRSEATVLLVGFPGAGHARPVPARWREGGAHPGRGDQRCGTNPRTSTNIPGMPTVPSWRAGLPRGGRSIGACFSLHGEEPALTGLAQRIAERTDPDGADLQSRSG